MSQSASPHLLQLPARQLGRIDTLHGVFTATHIFNPGDLVWPEGAKIHTNHLKAKLAPDIKLIQSPIYLGSQL
jgi:hypothetical protein